MNNKLRLAILEEMREWMRSDRNRWFQCDKRIEAIGGVLRRGTLLDKEKALIGGHLGILSNWYLILGTVRVADGDSAGWVDLAHGMRVDYWHIRLLVEQWDEDCRKNKQPRVELLRVCLCLAMAMAFERSAVVGWLGRRLEVSVVDGAFGKAWASCLPYLMLELYRRYIERGGVEVISAVGSEPNPYERVFNNWEDEEAVARAILGICDFHVERSEDRGDEVIGEFSRYPFNIVPFEVFAIEKVRTRVGLQTLGVAHPLLSAPFDGVPASVPDANDDLLDHVERLG